MSGDPDQGERREGPGAGAGAPGDVSILARRGLLSFVGSVTFAAFNFLWLFVVARGFGPSQAGALFEAVAIFQIAAGVVVFGSEMGLVRSTSRAVATGRTLEVRGTLLGAVAPVAFGGVLAAAIGAVFAPQLARVLTDASSVGDLEQAIRLLTPFLPAAALMYLGLAVSRGFGDMMPTVVVERIGRVSLQTLGAIAIVALGLGTSAASVAWGIPFGLGAVVALLWAMRQVRAEETRALGGEPPRPLLQLAASFWRFAAPRGLAATFQTGALWLDTLFLGALKSSRAAGVYTAGGRLTLVGSFVLMAVIQALGPQVSGMLARGEFRRAEHVYRTATWWLVAITWPIYLVLVIFSEPILRMFGPGYEDGASAIAIMSLAMLISMAFGPVDIVLLMSGKSFLNLANTIASLVTNITLNLLLIPRWGIAGAATAWAVSTAVNNLAPAVEVKLLLGIDAFGRSFLIPSLSSLGCVGVVGLAARAAFGASVPVMLGAGAAGCGLHALVLWRYRDELQLSELWRAFRRRPSQEVELEGPAL